MAVRVLIAENRAARRKEMQEIVGSDQSREIAGLARDGQEAVQMAIELEPHVALIAYDLPGMSGPQTCEMLSGLVPNLMTVLVADSVTDDISTLAMRSGARAVIGRPIDVAKLDLLISDLGMSSEHRRSPEFTQFKDPSRFPRVISVTGAKGGIGKSTIAVNLSATLAQTHPNKVALVDLYTQFGDVATMFNIAPKRTIAELGPVCQDLDTELIQSYVVAHPSGVHILSAAEEPLAIDAVTPECIDSLLHLLKRIYQYVVIDVPPMFYATTLHVLAHSTIILLVANLFDVTTATDTKKFFDALKKHHISKDSIGIVLNRVSKANKLQTADIERMLDSQVIAHVPNDSRLIRAVNDGQPFVSNDGDSPFGQSIGALANRIMGQSVDQDDTVPRKKLFGMI